MQSGRHAPGVVYIVDGDDDDDNDKRKTKRNGRKQIALNYNISNKLHTGCGVGAGVGAGVGGIGVVGTGVGDDVGGVGVVPGTGVVAYSHKYIKILKILKFFLSNTLMAVVEWDLQHVPTIQ